MAKTDPKTNNIILGQGDLIVNKDSQNVGILLAKHRLLRGYSEQTEQKPGWEWAWSIKWAKEKQKTGNNDYSWVNCHACSENSIINEIKEGSIEHYSVE